MLSAHSGSLVFSKKHISRAIRYSVILLLDHFLPQTKDIPPVPPWIISRHFASNIRILTCCFGYVKNSYLIWLTDDAHTQLRSQKHPPHVTVAVCVGRQAAYVFLHKNPIIQCVSNYSERASKTHSQSHQTLSTRYSISEKAQSVVERKEQSFRFATSPSFVICKRTSVLCRSRNGVRACARPSRLTRFVGAITWPLKRFEA